MLGVIGGNGVAATNRLCQLIEEKRTRSGAYRDDHHPEMIIWQATHAPSRSMYLEGRGPSFIEDYVNIGKSLKQLGCSELCMCCNTAHCHPQVRRIAHRGRRRIFSTYQPTKAGCCRR